MTFCKPPVRVPEQKSFIKLVGSSKDFNFPQSVSEFVAWVPTYLLCTVVPGPFIFDSFAHEEVTAADANSNGLLGQCSAARVCFVGKLMFEHGMAVLRQMSMSSRSLPNSLFQRKRSFVPERQPWYYDEGVVERWKTWLPTRSTTHNRWSIAWDNRCCERPPHLYDSVNE